MEIAAPLNDEDLLALHEALDELAGLDPLAAELIKLRFFTGLTHEEAADLLGLSRSAADRTWTVRPRLALPADPARSTCMNGPSRATGPWSGEVVGTPRQGVRARKPDVSAKCPYLSRSGKS